MKWAFVPSFVLLLACVSCSGEGYDGEEIVTGPNHDVFVKSVSPYLERRCGTLDCHGTMGRPMRLFGAEGLRHPSGTDVTGGAATTEVEREANFTSVCDVDPEPMVAVTRDRGASAEKLLLVNKARGAEKHKGGKIVNKTDAGDRCILGWLRLAKPEQVDADCKAALHMLD
jgi:hypothetical protein